MKLYLLTDYDTEDDRMYLVAAENCVAAAESVIAKIGGNPDVNRFGVSDPDVLRDGPVDIRARWWMFFSNDPDCQWRVL